MFATTSDELLRFFRAEVNDAVEPYLWEDFEAYGYMTEGFDALLKQGNVQFKVLSLPFTAGVATVSLPARVLHIRQAHIDGKPVNPANANSQGFERADDYGQIASSPSALFDSSGTPEHYVRDYEAKALRLVPIPDAAGTLELQCTVGLTFAMEEGVPLPSTDAEDLRLVLHYMKSLAYQKQDAETEDLVRAKYHAGNFVVGVTEREQRLRNYRRTPGTVRMDW